MLQPLQLLLYSKGVDSQYSCPVQSPMRTGLITMSNATDYSYFIRLTRLSLIVNGVISPFVIVLSLVTNALVCAVLLRRHMRSKTNSILVAMAVADTLTGTCPLPSYLRFYTWTLLVRGTVDPVPVRLPHGWCSFYFSSIDFLPTVFHTASIWLTVGLAVQRYICVSRFQPTAATTTGRQTGIFVLIASVYVVAALSQMWRFFEFRSVLFVSAFLARDSTPYSYNA